MRRAASVLVSMIVALGVSVTIANELKLTLSVATGDTHYLSVVAKQDYINREEECMATKFTTIQRHQPTSPIGRGGKERSLRKEVVAGSILAMRRAASVLVSMIVALGVSVTIANELKKSLRQSPWLADREVISEFIQ